MSYVAVYHIATADTPNKVLTHFDDIQSTLAEHRIGFERWQPSVIEKGASDAQMIAAYRPQIDALGYATAKVISVTGDHPQMHQLRDPLLVTRTCCEDNAYFFIAGQGLFMLHVGDYVYGVRAEKNDLLVIPAGMSHWLDIGENPHLVALRLFNTAQGEVPTFSADNMAARFPGLDD